MYKQKQGFLSVLQNINADVTNADSIVNYQTK